MAKRTIDPANFTGTISLDTDGTFKIRTKENGVANVLTLFVGKLEIEPEVLEKTEVKRAWWVTNKDAHPDNQRVIGPFTTATDAAVAREHHERKAGDHTFWLERLPQ